MHIEILVEDTSGRRLLDTIVPKILGGYGEPHTWKTIAYKGVGRIPRNLKPATDATKRILLDNLPRLLRGYGRTPGIDCVVVVVDADNRDCGAFLNDLNGVVAFCTPSPNVLFRLAIEEVEAWYFGDQEAILLAYPKARREVLGRYRQDSVCGTWELLADALHAGGSSAIKKLGFPASGKAKHDWAENIGPRMDPNRNVSPSFCKLRDGLRRLAPTSSSGPKQV